MMYRVVIGSTSPVKQLQVNKNHRQNKSIYNTNINIIQYYVIYGSIFGTAELGFRNCGIVRMLS